MYSIHGVVEMLQEQIMRNRAELCQSWLLM